MTREYLKQFKKELGVTLAIEGADIVVQDEPIEDVPEAESVSAEAIETIGDTAEVADLDAEAEKLTTVDEMGEELVTAVESAIATGKGLRPLEAAALRLTTKQITKRYSNAPAEAIPAREEFGGTADAYDTTVLAHESLKESFSTFWESAKAMFLKVIDAIQRAFRKVMSLFTSVTKRAQALKARAEAEESQATGTVKVNADSLRVGQEPLNVAVVGGLKNILDLVSALLKSGRQIDDRAEVNKGVEAIKDENAWKTYVQGVNGYARRTFDAIDSSKEGVSTLLPGNRAVTFTEGEEGSRDQFSFESLVRFGDEKEDVRDVPTLNRKEIIDVADCVIAITEQIGQYDKIWSRSATKAARLIQGINAAVKTEETKGSKDEGADAADVTEKETRFTRFKINVTALIAHVRHIDKFASDLISYAQTTAVDALSYGEKSLSDVTVTNTELQTA